MSKVSSGLSLGIEIGTFTHYHDRYEHHDYDHVYCLYYSTSRAPIVINSPIANKIVTRTTSTGPAHQ